MTTQDCKEIHYSLEITTKIEAKTVIVTVLEKQKNLITVRNHM